MYLFPFGQMKIMSNLLTALHMHHFSPATTPSHLVILVGVVGGILTSMNMMYTYNLVGRSFCRFRPIAFGILNVGAPAGNAVMTIIASTLITR